MTRFKEEYKNENCNQGPDREEGVWKVSEKPMHWQVKACLQVDPILPRHQIHLVIPNTSYHIPYTAYIYHIPNTWSQIQHTNWQIHQPTHCYLLSCPNGEALEKAGLRSFLQQIAQGWDGIEKLSFQIYIEMKLTVWDGTNNYEDLEGRKRGWKVELCWKGKTCEHL